MFYRKILILFAAISLLIIPSAIADSVTNANQGSDIYEATEITILEPAALKEEFNLLKDRSLTVANFGLVPWGRTLVGNAYLATPTNACTLLSPIDLHHDNDNVDSEDPDRPIIIVDRGDCTFDVKSINAQLSGAKALIIIDNVEGENLNFLIPIADKFGTSVYIPTILLDKHSGDLIKKHLNKTAAVSLSISFELPKSYNKTKIDLWLTSSDLVGFDFVNSLQETRKKLKDVIEFTPHPVLWYCLQCERVGYVGTDLDPNCVSSGRHCSPDPDGNGPLSGSQVLLEDLRQLCLFKHSQDAWWAYFGAFNKSCLQTADLQKCSENALKNIGVSVEKIQNCVNESFSGGPPEKTENQIFANESQSMRENMIRLWPTLLINKQMYRGNLFPADLIFEAICDGFEIVPKECLYDDLEGLTPQVQTGKHFATLIIILVIIFLGVLFVAIFICYKRRLKQEVNQEMEFMISTTMQKYVQLKDNNN